MPASEPDEPYHRTNGRELLHDQTYTAVRYFSQSYPSNSINFLETSLLNGSSLVSWFIALYCPYRSRLSTIIAQKAPHVFARFCELGYVAMSRLLAYRCSVAVVAA